MTCCKECIFSESKNNNFVYCKNIERCVRSWECCCKHISKKQKEK